MKSSSGIDAYEMGRLAAKSAMDKEAFRGLAHALRRLSRQFAVGAGRKQQAMQSAAEGPASQALKSLIGSIRNQGRTISPEMKLHRGARTIPQGLARNLGAATAEYPALVAGGGLLGGSEAAERISDLGRAITGQ